MDNSIIQFEDNTYCVFVSSKTDKRLGKVFCEGVILDHGTLTLTLTEKAFDYMPFSDTINMVESEILLTDFSPYKSSLRYCKLPE